MRCFSGEADSGGEQSREYAALRGLCHSAFERSFQGLIQRGFGFFIFLMGNATLLMFNFELKKFFFESFEQQTGMSP